MGQVIVRNLDDQVIETRNAPRRAGCPGAAAARAAPRGVPTGDERLRRANEIAALTPTLPAGQERTPAES